jgi:DNA-binding MarR family transcriptional regulator
MMLSPDAAVLTEPEIRFLLAIADRVAESPAELPRPMQLARQLGLDYDEAVELVNRLDDRRLLHRCGSSQVLSDMRVFLTSKGIRMLLQFAEPISGEARPPRSRSGGRETLLLSAA